jgi:phosphohistidine swiveling domain-containing protein
LSEVSFALPDPVFEDYTWLLFDEHGPVCQTPLLEEDNFGPRIQPGALPRALRINGYMYMRDDIAMNPFASSAVSTRDELREWRTLWQPQVDAVVGALYAFDPANVRPGEWAETLQGIAGEFWRVFVAIHRTAVGPAQVTAEAFTKAYVAKFGAEREDDARALLQGFPNASLDRACMLWDLSRIVRRVPDVLSSLDGGGGWLMAETPVAREFQQRLEALLDRYGESTNANTQDAPTWREDPATALAQVRAFAAQPDGSSPQEAAAHQRARREALEAELRTLAETDPEVAALLPLLEAAQEFVPNLEDHNYLTDQRLLAGSRARWLNIGRLLHARGRLADPTDVFYVYQRELIPALEGADLPSQGEIEARRSFVAACRAVAPPPLLGKGAHSAPASVIRGVGASKGRYRGTARIIDAVEDAVRLQPGDVLVCRATTPAWTPYFGIVGAVVTNTGGTLSHTAIVAREFGIPAVLGTRDASVQIPEGATVIVDGGQGTVTVENEG